MSMSKPDSVPSAETWLNGRVVALDPDPDGLGGMAQPCAQQGEGEGGGEGVTHGWSSPVGDFHWALRWQQIFT